MFRRDDPTGKACQTPNRRDGEKSDLKNVEPTDHVRVSCKRRPVCSLASSLKTAWWLFEREQLDVLVCEWPSAETAVFRTEDLCSPLPRDL